MSQRLYVRCPHCEIISLEVLINIEPMTCDSNGQILVATKCDAGCDVDQETGMDIANKLSNVYGPLHSPVIPAAIPKVYRNSTPA